jgi:hypothetical protein
MAKELNILYSGKADLFIQTVDSHKLFFELIENYGLKINYYFELWHEDIKHENFIKNHFINSIINVSQIPIIEELKIKSSHPMKNTQLMYRGLKNVWELFQKEGNLNQDQFFIRIRYDIMFNPNELFNIIQEHLQKGHFQILQIRHNFFDCINIGCDVFYFINNYKVAESIFNCENSLNNLETRNKYFNKYSEFISEVFIEYQSNFVKTKLNQNVFILRDKNHEICLNNKFQADDIKKVNFMRLVNWGQNFYIDRNDIILDFPSEFNRKTNLGNIFKINMQQISVIYLFYSMIRYSNIKENIKVIISFNLNNFNFRKSISPLKLIILKLLLRI